MSILDPARVSIKLGDYGTAPATALSDPSLLPRVQDYRRQVSARMYPLDQKDIKQKVPKAEFLVSRKIDGEFTVLIYRDGETFTLNPGGTVRVGLPWQDEIAAALKKAGVKEAMIVGELYVRRDDGSRARVHDVVTIARQPKDNSDLGRLCFAVFDLMSVNDENVGENYGENWNTIRGWFADGDRVHPVQTETASGDREVGALFKQWVTEEGAEGIVARSHTAGTFKIKPRHTIEAAVIGFTESTDDRQGMMHDLLLAVMRNDGSFHVMCRVGGGFSEDERRAMLSDLKDMVVDSEYAEVNSDHVAYQMVEPKWIIEISCLDLVAETTRGGTINRMVLDWNKDGSGMYHVVRRLPLVSVISPQFLRIRDDKSATPGDISINQLADLVPITHHDRDAGGMTLPKSELLEREVFTKVLKGETMVRKFLVWKTNKENELDEFPAYVVHYTDFSPNRKAPLSREVRVSDSQEQILSLRDQLKEGNIKKGWNPVGDAATEQAPADASEKKPAAKKKAATKTKKTAAAKSTKKKAAAPKKKTAAKKKSTSTTKKKTAKKKSTKTKMAASERDHTKGTKKGRKKSG